MSKQVVLLAIDNISERKNLANNAKLSSLLKSLLIRCSRVAFGDEAKFSVSVFLRSIRLILIFLIFFLILQDSCKPLCHLQRCKGHLSTYNYVLECFMPLLHTIELSHYKADTLKSFHTVELSHYRTVTL